MNAAICGTVLRIERTAIHDGDGLRVVVFLKGCPLRCQWCSTPESQAAAPEGGYGQEMTADEVLREISRDEIFFFHSGGGVTLSGGEPLAQPDFVAALLAGCRERGIDTALETSLYAPYPVIRRLLPDLTALYVDFKLFDAVAHRRYTGVDNELIKNNLRQTAHDFRGDLHLRIPVVPGVNMTADNMTRTAEFAAALPGLRDIELLPYHRLGVATYAKLGRVYPLPDVEPLQPEQLRQMAALLHAAAPDCPLLIRGERYPAA